MKKGIFHTIIMLVLLLSSADLSAQSMGEDAYIRYYLGRSVQRTKLFNEMGLGKLNLLKNIPAYWIGGYERSHSLTDIQGLFGAVNPSFDWLSPNAFRLDFSGSHFGELDLSLRGALEYKKISVHLSANGHWIDKTNDYNQDNYLDLPRKKRLLLYNRWSVYLKNFTSINNIWFMGLERQAGELDFDKKTDFLTTNAYGYGTGFNHLVGESNNYIAAREKDMAIIKFRVVDHTQQNYFGQRQYTAKQWGISTKATYSYMLQNGFDMFKFGLNYEYKVVRESLDSVELNRVESFGGGVVGYETYFGNKFKLSTRVNINYHSLAKWVFIPHLRFAAKINDKFAFNVFGGNGLRYANALNEHLPFLVSSRSVLVREDLRPERAWYYGVSMRYARWINLGWSFLFSSNLQFYHTIYQNKIIADLDHDPYALTFYNLDGKANKYSVELDVYLRATSPSIGLNIDYRFDFVRTTIDSAYVQEPLLPAHVLLIGLDYRLRIRGKHILDISSQWHWYSQQRLPDTYIKSKLYGTKSPSVLRWDIRLDLPFYQWVPKRSRWKNVAFYVGIDNLLNAVQQFPFIAQGQPFGADFDAGLQWNTTVGRRFYGGFTYTFK